MHSPTSHVRIFDYILSHDPSTDASPVSDLIITSLVHFTSSAESHKGLCHGGTMCAVMDDVIGWTGFCESGHCLPWSGYTVQVDTSLKKAIPVGSLLKVEGWVERREGKRKIHIKARLSDEEGTEYATGSGLFLKK
jgi:acyl-coenzyme A thioesterase PaaI-like protein